MTQRPLRAKQTKFVNVRNRMTSDRVISGQRGLVLLLALLAATAVTLIRIDASWAPWTIWVPTLVSTVVAIALMMIAPSRAATKNPGGLWISITALLIVYVVPWNFLVKSVMAHTGEPLELIMLAMVQQAAIVSVTLYPVRKAEWISGLLSFFLFVFCITMSSAQTVYVLAGLYGLLSIWWLMGAYWERIQGGFVAQQSVPVVRLRASILISLVALLLVLAYVGSTRSTTLASLLGFMPTSGGSGENDESARSGIGDGDRVVAAQDTAMSFGPVESELFLEDTSPSLYDMFSDIYGDDPKVTKRAEKAVSLPGAEGPQKHQHLSQSQKSSREFSAVRRAKLSQEKKPEQKLTSAMLYLIGDVPTHLVMETFDAFDGRQWTHQQPIRATELKLSSIGEKPYINFIPKGSISYALTEQVYGIKLINLKSPRIPSPHLLSGVHIDKVDRVDFYSKTRDDVPEMIGREHIPQLTVLHLRTYMPHIHALRNTSNFRKLAWRVRSEANYVLADEVRKSQQEFDVTHPDGEMLLQPLPQAETVIDGSPIAAETSSSIEPALKGEAKEILDAAKAFEVYYQIAAERDLIEELSSQWTRGVSRGWSEVDTILSRLKDEFEHDPTATAPEECEDVVAHFLKTKRGPDYLFASTAAMLLRARGFPTRLVTGFYADPQDFEYATGQTVIRKEDLHTWLQVSIDGTNWISIEATPGYLSPIEDLNWFEWAQLGFWSTCRWVWQHPLTVLSVLVALSWAIWARVWIIELGLTLWVAIVGNMGSLRNRTLWLMWLLQCRGKLYGKPRPRYKTLRSWLSEVATDSASVRDFIPHVERMLYAPPQANLAESDNEYRKLYRLLLWGRRTFTNQHTQTSQ
jgi:hypothetical protein